MQVQCICPHCGTSFRTYPSQPRTFCSRPCKYAAAKWSGVSRDDFMAKVQTGSECWLWTGQRDKFGYGRVSVGSGQKRLAHRIAYQLLIGPIPDGLLVCHRCDNPSCVRPDHLFVGTHRDNTLDMVSKGRSVLSPSFKAHQGQTPSGAKRGEQHPGAKLTAEQVSAIRIRAASGETSVSLGAAYGVHPGHVKNILRRRSWRHIA